jgi:hypothetical protein
MFLANAIDDLLAFVPAADGQYPWSDEWQDRFNCLDQAVWVEACLLGLEGKLPRRYPGHVDFWGQTQMPVFGKYKYATDQTFVPVGLRAWRNSLLALRALAEAKAAGCSPAADRTDPPDNYADFRLGPGGPLLTAELCWERFRVSNPALSKQAKKDPSIRRKNPAGGSGYVYRYDVVSLLANRKADDE